MINRLYCPLCGEKTEFSVREEVFAIPVKKEEVFIEGKRAFCIKHNEELFHPIYDVENQDAAFVDYRKRHQLVTPDQIKESREKYQLSQREYSYLLGFGEITISRYERGSLPTRAQNQIIRESFDAANMYKLIGNHDGKIPLKRVEELKSQFPEVHTMAEDLVREVKSIFQHPPDIMSGNRLFHYDKFAEMVRYFAEHQNPYVTKLNKLMFYADFTHFKNFNTSISGSHYVRNHYGPVPNKYQLLYDAVNGVEIVENEYGYLVQKKDDEVGFFHLNAKELKTLNDVAKKFKRFSSLDISNFSHDERAWRDIELKESISYYYAEMLDEERESSSL